MCKSFVKQNLLHQSNSWNEAISDAEEQLQEAQQKIVNLKRGINAFKKLRDNGEPFPGESTTQTKEASR